MAVLDAVISALPAEYNKDTQKAIKEHVTNLTRTFANLIPQIPPAHIRPPKLAQCSFLLEGTIPVTCPIGEGRQGNFNIPVRIWIDPKYPKVWPTVILNPTARMMIASNHKHVDRDGVCYCQYLTDWVRDTKKKNLMDLILELCRIFGAASPLYEARQPAVQPPQPGPGFYNGYVPAPGPTYGGFPPTFVPGASYPNAAMGTYSNPIAGPPLGVGTQPMPPMNPVLPVQPAPPTPQPAPAPVPVVAVPVSFTPSAGDSGDDENLCVVCLSEKKTMLFLPCKHLATCESCSGQIGNQCPTCRSTIDTKMKIFT